MKPIKPPYTTRQLLVCTHTRDPASGKPSCGANGAQAFRDGMKKTLKARGLKGTYLVTATGCMDICPDQGCTVAFQPEGEFFLSDTTEEAAAEALARLTGV